MACFLGTKKILDVELTCCRPDDFWMICLVQS
jgi:hypothetical protein